MASQDLKPLVVVTDAFGISGRGTVVVPSVPHEPRWPATVSLQVRRPDGTRIAARGQVRREHLLRRPPARSEWVWTLCLEVPKSEVPPGTELWELP